VRTTAGEAGVTGLARARAAGGWAATILALAGGACARGDDGRADRAAAGGAAGEGAGATPAAAASARNAAAPACAPDNGGLTLPTGFCATVFADSVGGARHVAVAANGDVFVARTSPNRPRAGNESGQGARVGVLALRDATATAAPTSRRRSAAPAARAWPPRPGGCTSTRGRAWCATRCPSGA
jgi:hypothetical protein